jgi:hypothetical protein
VKPIDVSSGLLPLETGEVPAEYRLFFDAPILAAYRYTTRPFNLKLALSPLEQGKSLDQVVDRASLVTRISKEGQVLSDVTYFVKNRGNPNFKITLPAQTELWSATVNGTPVVPVKDGSANLIPLPQRADPNAVLALELKLASTSSVPSRVTVAAPIVNAPVMLAEWKLAPDAGQRLAFVKGSLTPVGGLPDVSGFAQLTRMFSGGTAGRAFSQLALTFVLLIAALILWRWASRAGVQKFSAQHIVGTVIGFVAIFAAALALTGVFELAAQHRGFLANDVAFLAPVQQSGSALSVEVANVSEKVSGFSVVRSALPILVALVLWIVGWLSEADWKKSFAKILGWSFLTWAALRLPNGVPWFLAVLIAFLVVHALIPALRRLWSLPPKPATGNRTAPAVATLVLFALLHLSVNRASAASSDAIPTNTNTTAETPGTQRRKSPAVSESVSQQIRAEEDFVLATAKIRWRAEKGQSLPLLFEPAVLTRITNTKDAWKLVQTTENGKRVQRVLAQQSGTFDIEVQYQLQVTKRGTESGFTLPTTCGLINELSLTAVGLDVDVLSPQAVSVRRELAGSNTVATLVLSPVNDAWIGWKPRSRDVKREKTVFYAEVSQLYVPSAGVIEGSASRCDPSGAGRAERTDSRRAARGYGNRCNRGGESKSSSRKPQSAIARLSLAF